MRAQLDHLISSALQNRAAVPAFTCYDFTTALAIVSAAESAGLSVILLVAPRTAATAEGLRLVSALRGLADSAAVPVSVQLDHATDIQVIVDAVKAGADAVLVDGSHLPYEDNISLVREARSAIQNLTSSQVVIEAELGGLAGDEDRAFGVEPASHANPGLTDASLVEDFVARTAAQLLAVAVGNAHGKYNGEPRLQWDLLRGISSCTTVPLVLHGASGLAPVDLQKAATAGVGKVNFNTELRTGVLDTLQAHTAFYRADGENLQGLLALWSNSANAFAAKTLATLTPDHSN